MASAKANRTWFGSAGKTNWLLLSQIGKYRTSLRTYHLGVSYFVPRSRQKPKYGQQKKKEGLARAEGKKTASRRTANAHMRLGPVPTPSKKRRGVEGATGIGAWMVPSLFCVLMLRTSAVWYTYCMYLVGMVSSTLISKRKSNLYYIITCRRHLQHSTTVCFIYTRKQV